MIRYEDGMQMRLTNHGLPRLSSACLGMLYIYTVFIPFPWVGEDVHRIGGNTPHVLRGAGLDSSWLAGIWTGGLNQI